MRPFHFSTIVTDLKATRRFYSEVLELPIKREYSSAIHYDFFGHQLVLHLASEIASTKHQVVDNHDVPVPHFGVILNPQELKRIEQNLKNHNVNIYREGHTRFIGEPHEQYVIFVYDPSGNALEFKYYTKQNEYDW